jgi:inosine-uridine nucleoside N-ribohydrolase
MKVIIDTDPGVDDALAILMALACTDLEVLGLTTVGGNVALAQATTNALALLEYTQRPEVPVARGAARPRRGRFPYSHYFHGPSGLSRRLPRPRTSPVETSAVGFLADQLQQCSGQITLVALGPLTNLARLLRRNSTVLNKVQDLPVMGGAVNVPGNVTPHAEFNFYSDPVAAHEVLSSGVPLTVVDLGACRQVFITKDEAEKLNSPNPLGRLAAQLLVNWFARGPERHRFEFYDPLTLAAAIQPGLINTREVTLSVEVEDENRLGESRIVREGGPHSVVKKVDEKGFFRLFRDLLELDGRGL